MTAAPHCELLDWDSRFFGVRIARLFGSTIDEAACESALRWARDHAIQCLYFLAAPDDARTIAIAERHAFHLVDIRVEFDREIAPMDAVQEARRHDPGSGSPDSIRKAEAGDLPRLRELATDGHRITRFYQDPHFSRDRCDELYRTWITESLGGLASGVMVAIDAGRINGYVTVVIDGDVARIGLIAVDSRARGRGHGGRLVEAALQYASERGARQMLVATQAGNIEALRLYERHGFRTARVGLWFHRWFDD